LSRLHHIYFNDTSISGYPGNPPASRLPATKVTTSAYIFLFFSSFTMFEHSSQFYIVVTFVNQAILCPKTWKIFGAGSLEIAVSNCFTIHPGSNFVQSLCMGCDSHLFSHIYLCCCFDVLVFQLDIVLLLPLPTQLQVLHPEIVLLWRKKTDLRRKA
jgi:hypothetical protein